MRALILAPHLPYPRDNGGRIRLAELATGLVEAGHNVTVLGGTLPQLCKARQPASAAGGAEIRSFALRNRTRPRDKLAALFSVYPEGVWRCTTTSAREEAQQLARRADVIVVSQMHAATLVPRDAHRVVLDTYGVETATTWQMAREAPRLRMRARLGADALKYQRFEQRLFQQAAGISCVSLADQDAIAAITTVPTAVHPNGVDTTSFAYQEPAPRGTRLLMTGTLGYPPNIGGTLWFLDEIWPLVRRSMPTATVAFVGSSAPRELTERNDQDQGVEVVSDVPSMQPYLRAADAFIVPLRVGGGTRLKVLEALASGLPVVSTHKGVEGLRREVHDIAWLADEAAGFAAACIQALEDAPARRAAAPRGRAIAEKYYEWSSISAEFAHWVEQLANA